ncbi:hypothetical protein C6Q07_29400, partial [Burkholderia multivorans]|uniref:hypothetical protein n=1 Tax=Burkholderia multivorans TaxID=87883 RepID=UPI000D46ECFE
VVPMPEVNSSPRKLTAPRGLFETVSKDHVRKLCLVRRAAARSGAAIAVKTAGKRRCVRAIASMQSRTATGPRREGRTSVLSVRYATLGAHR